MTKQERIVCAAVRSWIGDEEKVELFVRYPEKYLSNNAQIGLVGYEKGFITNQDRFIRPDEAVEIASNAHQIKELSKLYGEYFKINDIGSHADARAAFKKYMDAVQLKKSEGLKPEDLY